MKIFDNLKEIKKLDRSNVLGSLEFLPHQCEQAWQEVKKIKVPKNYRQVTKAVINGMGGSGLGGHVIQSLFYDQLKIPLGIIHTYDLPGCLDKKTLYILSSYSGTTEEPISTGSTALRRRAKVLGITTGKKLGRFLKKNKIPAYIINPQFNICGEPRMGLGYSIVGLLGLLKKCGVIKIQEKTIKEIVQLLKNSNRKFGVQNKTSQNPAKKLALALKDKIPILVGAEFLVGNVHVVSNQINENSKNFATYFVIPELNHHLMEGLAYPKEGRKILKFLFIESDLYFPKVQARFKVTQEVVKRSKVNFLVYRMKSKNKILQSFELLSLGGYLNFYLALLNRVNPAPISWVDYFKERLAKF